MEPERLPTLAGNSDKIQQEVLTWNKTFLSIKDLTSIKGVGLKTVEELQGQFANMKELVIKLKNDEKFFIDKFRDDVVKKMKIALFL